MLDPKNYESFYGRGNCYYYLDDYVKALEDFNSSLILCKDFSEIWYSKADAEIALGYISDALKSYENVIRLESKNYDAWFDYGCALIEANKFNEAIQAFENVSKINSIWSEPFYVHLVRTILRKIQNLFYYRGNRKRC